MLDINWVCKNVDQVEQALKERNEQNVDLETFVKLNQDRKNLQFRSDEIKHERKEISTSFQKAKKAGEDVAPLQEKTKALKNEEKEIDARLTEIKQQQREFVMRLPNLPHEDAPKGGEESNKVTRTEGEKPAPFDFDAKDHMALCEDLGFVDVNNRGVKIAGSGFALYQGIGAKLVRSLINFMLDLHTDEHGYKEIAPPLLVTRKTMTGTGQLPKFEDDLYHCSKDDLFLIPTAEVPVTNLLSDEILSPKQLPVAYTAYTPCFRREAGSYGADTRGLMRLHQFDKVELVRFCLPEESEAEHQKLLGHAEKVLNLLGLHYRVLELASGDMGFAAARCYDLEVWAPVSERWFEVSSVSNFRDFQARRANIRYRKEAKKVEFVHTLNGSGLALPRIILCILEQYQTDDGRVRVPDALRPYLRADFLSKDV
ncbi:MAG: serine--tRNA ligase [Planctomycetota bacterium]|nr:serine--tRNA ligase [Planctomycetota bacterium]